MTMLHKLGLSVLLLVVANVGLSAASQFQVRVVPLANEVYDASDTITAKVIIKNTGKKTKATAEHIFIPIGFSEDGVLMTVSSFNVDFSWPTRSGFEKPITFKRGQQRTFKLKVKASALNFYNPETEDRGWQTGDYSLRLQFRIKKDVKGKFGLGGTAERHRATLPIVVGVGGVG